ncbi:MAG: hypothetical protein QOG12_1603, partial [Verrucomicrobiota bacterium]
MKGKPTTPTEYLASLPPHHKAAFTAIHKAIRKAVPELKPCVRYGALGYGPYHYKYESGREGESAVVGLASRKAGITLYIAGNGVGGYLAERNASRLGKVSVGRTCIRFTKLEHLNLKVAIELVREAARQHKSSLK